MADRSLWFESHLFADRRGRRARTDCEQLGVQAHEVILAAGDRLASTSPVVAQQFYRHAAAAWRAFGGDQFARWVDLGATLLSSEPAQRDAALAYFSVAPKALARAGLERLDAWCAAGARVAAISRKLGATFFEGTAPFIGQIDVDVLAEWVGNGIRLQGLPGWRGEFLAQAYLAAAGQVLPHLRAGEFGPWADIGVALQPVLRENQSFGQLPPGLERLQPAERVVLFDATLTMAAVSPAAAAVFYTKLPTSLGRLPARVRLKVLQAFSLVGASAASSLPEIVPVVGALVRDLPAEHRHAALDLVLMVARTFPAGTTALLRSLPAAYEEARHAAIAQWVARGLAIAAENPEAGVAYFGLQSRTSVKVLQASSTAATLEDMQGLLRKYVQMLSGRSTTIRAAVPFQLRPPLEESPLENDIALPLRIDTFATHEENCRAYRFVAAQLAGRREFGTYEVILPPDADGLLQFLRAPQHPALLEELFLVAEGYRVAAALARTYPGLAREQREIVGKFLLHHQSDGVPTHAVLFDALLAAALAGHEPTCLPVWLRSLAAVVAPCLAPLAVRDASADDSLRIAQLLTMQLAEPAAGWGEASLADLITDREREAVDALMDFYMDDDAPLPSGDAPLVTTPAAPPVDDAPEELRLQLDELEDGTGGLTVPLSAEELQRLIEAGADLRMKQGYSDDIEGLGLYITDLLGKLAPEQLEELRQLLSDTQRADRPLPRRWLERRNEGASFYYDEWDYHIGDYRQRWCCLREVAVDGDSGEFFNRTLADYAGLIPEVRRQFQRIRPEMYRTVRGLEDGEDFDLNAVVNARADLRANRAPSSKVYVARTREERDVATLFLIDMSASTDEPVQKPAAPAGSDDGGQSGVGPHGKATVRARRIIDITKEALVIMAEALAEIGDAYAIYGFSGHGRSNVEFYLVKSFNEPLSTAVKGRIGAIEPKRSTRMGTALRHATGKLAGVNSRSRHIILLSDGFPQDFDYGQDRRSNVYGLRDTSAALREAETSGITPFCITVDKAGHDYLREMCDGSRYMVIDDINALPRELPKIYQRVVTV
ncbi:MAG: VWA domain-containing protein [Candidatus Binatia bacterium]